MFQLTQHFPKLDYLADTTISDMTHFCHGPFGRCVMLLALLFSFMK